MNLSASQTTTTTSRRLFDPATAMILAVVFYGTAVRNNSPGGGLAVTLATLLVAYAVWRSHKEASLGLDEGGPWETRLLAAILVFSLLGALGWAPAEIGPTSAWLERLPSLAWAGLAIWLFLTRRGDSRQPVMVAVTVLTVALTLLVGIIHLSETRNVSLDVNLLHRASADAIAGGENPYSEAVETPVGSPTAGVEETIVGYPYPPVTALSYAVGEWVFSDPRFISLISWVAVLTLLGVSGIRQKRPSTLLLMLLLASMPGWPLMLRAAWTEPLTLAFLTISLVLWHRAVGSGLALGLGLASKQYFVVTAPLLLLHRDPGWMRRLVIAASVVVVTIGAALAIGPADFWSAAVEYHMNTPVRVDSSNLIGLLSSFGVDWAPPAVLGLVAGLLAAMAVGRMSHRSATFMIGMALTLAVSFLPASQAFANYWFLIAGLLVLGMAGGATGEARETAYPEEPRPNRDAR